MTRASGTWLLAATATLFLGARRYEPQETEKDELCRVFVSVAKGQDDSSNGVLEEVHKEIKKKKDWFRLLDEELSPDVHVELDRFGNADELKADVERAEGAAGSQSTTMQRPALLDLKSGYFIEFRMTVLDKFRTTMTATGHGKKQASRSLVKQLHAICETYVE
jgi:hypothetical protein